MAGVAKAVSSGSLRGARGNSGVILSQLLRGFSKVVTNYEVIDSIVLANAFQKAVETAYKAVMKVPFLQLPEALLKKPLNWLSMRMILLRS